MSSEHTPGPWKAINQTDHISTGEHIWDIQAPNGGVVCWIDGLIASDLKAANARLIAAAPELLEALKDLQKVVRDEYHLLDVKKRYSLCVADMIAGKAIAKAEGREP